MPEQNEVRRNPQTGQTVVWTGSQWMNFKNPNEGIPSGRTDTDDSELLKQFLTTGGTMAGGAVGGMPGAIAGGAIGRTLGHVPEALHSAATGAPNSGSFFADPALGAMEGATQDVLPRILGPIMKWGGRGVKAVGDMLPENAWHRLIGGEAATEMLGGPRGVGGAAAMAAKPVLTGVGNMSERAGSAMEGKNLSQHLQEMIDGLRGPEAAPLHSELNAGAAEKYASDKAAKAAQQGAAAKASGLGADLGEAPQPIRPNWHEEPTPAEDSWPGMGPDVEPRTAPTPASTPTAPSTPTSAPTVGRALPRGDDFWGPGSRTRAGDFAQATEGSGNPLYDPQTPTNYLRELLRDATDPTDRAWLAKAIDQRYRIQRSISGMAGK